MKKLFLLFAMIFGLTSLILAQVTVQVQGTVTRDSTNLPVAGHEVIIKADSNPSGFTFWAQRFTNPNGFYDCTISNVPGGVQTTFIVKTKNCDSTWMVQTFQTTNSPAIVNFILCNAPVNCEAGFFTHADSANALQIHFDDDSYPHSEVTTWIWDFGDGSVTTIVFPLNPNVTHTYGNAGVYHPCLSINTLSGCTSIKCKEVLVGQPAAGCEARFEFSHDSLNAPPYTCHFFDTSTGQPTQWAWDFGDPASGLNNSSTWKNPTHSYMTAGVYYVCLSILGDSCQDSKCDSIYIGTNPVNCVSYFTYNWNFLTVGFESHVTGPAPFTFSWNFGDPSSGNSNVSSEPHPHHLFTSPGSYTVTLVTVASNGCTWSSSQTIWVNATCDLYGTVYMGNTFVDHGLIDLIRVDSGNVMTVIQSRELGDSAGMYWFGGVVPGQYYLKAQLLSTSSRFGDFVPTYYEDAINWANANLIELGQPENPYNFHLIEAGSLAQGNGIIGGTVTQGTKVNTGGTPAQNVEVLLLDPSSHPLGVVMTDVNGHFEFTGIAMGSYIVYPEVAGMTTTPAHVTLDNAHITANTPFIMNGTQIIYGINDKLPQFINRISEIYPNPPTSGVAGIGISVTRELDLNLSLYDQTGQVIREFRFTLHKGDNLIRFVTEGLAKGPYYLKIGAGSGGSVIRKLFIVQ